MVFAEIVSKEIRNVKENMPFNAATILSPLLFLFAFAVMVSGGITLPVETQPEPSSSDFLQSVASFRAPDGTPYLELEPVAKAGQPDGRSADRYIVVQEPQPSSVGMTGRITHVVNDVNANMTKNYGNRLNGAVLNYVNHNTQAGTLEVREHTWYPADIPWDVSYAVSSIVFGAMLAGLLFGQLSMTSEWENSTTKLLALSPSSASVIVCGKIAAAFIKSVAAGSVLVAVVAWMFPAPWAHPWHLVAALTLIYVTFASLGLMLGIVIRATMTAFLISLVVSLSLWVAGGGFGDLSYFGPSAQAVGAMNPATYCLTLARYAYFGGSIGFLPLVLLALGATVSLAGAIALFSKWTRSERAAS